jgi:hypothetical protein
MLLYQNIPKESQKVATLFENLVYMFERSGKQIILIHLSDEFSADKIDFYAAPCIKHIIRNYWRPNLSAKVSVIPLGYATGRSGGKGGNFDNRKALWSFIGSSDRPGRTEAIDILKSMSEENIVHLKPSWSSFNEIGADNYCKVLQASKFVPCFGGYHSMESFRIYEALENGAIPIYVPGSFDEIKAVLGASCPLLAFPSWEKVAELLPSLAKKPDVMEKHRNTISEWWETKKSEYKQNIKHIIKELNQ